MTLQTRLRNALWNGHLRSQLLHLPTICSVDSALLLIYFRDLLIGLAGVSKSVADRMESDIQTLVDT